MALMCKGWLAVGQEWHDHQARRVNDWPALLDVDIERFSRVLNDKSVRSRLRAWRGWQVRKRRAPITTTLQS